MVMAADLSHQLGGLEKRDVARITAVLERTGLPLAGPDFPPERYVELMSVDKKVKDGALQFVVLEGIGQARVRSDVPQAAVRNTLTAHATEPVPTLPG
jgi:3-dehydroquinate synthase